MTNMAKFTIMALAGLFATRFCTAVPVKDVLVQAIDKRVSGDLINWPGLLGENNIPKPEHLVQAYNHYKAQGDKLDEWHKNLIRLGGTSFWATLHTLSEYELGWSIKNVLEIPEGENSEDRVIVKLKQYIDGAWTEDNQEVVAYKGDVPSWPFVIAEAVRKAGWEPQTPEESANDDAERLLELIEGRQVDTHFDVKSAEVIWEVVEIVYLGYPKLIFLDSIGWFAVTEITDALKQEFTISLFPFLDGEASLKSAPITAIDFYQKFGSVIKKIV